ncbi:MAG: hypothetical protein WBP53_16190 [Dokdonella sp.]
MFSILSMIRIVISSQARPAQFDTTRKILSRSSSMGMFASDGTFPDWLLRMIGMNHWLATDAAVGMDPILDAHQCNTG